MWQAPIAVIFFGSALYHLYFLPLLFSGALLVFLTNKLLTRENGTIAIAFLAVFSIITNEIIAQSGNLFQLNSPLAFPSLLNLLEYNSINYQIARFILMKVAWMLNFLLYICVDLILNYSLGQIN